MNSARLIPGLLFAAVSFLCISAGSLAHEGELAHAHVGGGVSHPPYPFTMTTWYRDIVYDDTTQDASQTSLDLYAAEPVEPGSPVMIWVHGGGLVVGDKAHSKELDPKPEYFTSKLGYLFVSTNYRLLPEGQYPANVQDVANALAWVHDNIADFGGDPDQIYLMGHSAGATLVAQVATDETFLENAGKGLGIIKGAIVVDGSNYDLHASGSDPDRLQFSFGPDWENASAAGHIAAGKDIPPFLFLHVAGGSEFGNSETQAVGMSQRLRAAGARADVVALDHVEHFGANERIGEPGDHTTVAVEQFLMSLPGRKRAPGWVKVEFGGSPAQ